MLNPEAFVYCWTDRKTSKLYVGYHKGTLDDGYICSSKTMLQEFAKRPEDFSRQIVAEGTFEDIRKLETVILKSVDAKHDSQFYNQHNGNGEFYNKGYPQAGPLNHNYGNRGPLNPLFGVSKSLEHRRKMSEAWKHRLLFSDSTRRLQSLHSAKNSLGKHWFNNGSIERYSTTQPEGWLKGRLPRIRNKDGRFS